MTARAVHINSFSGAGFLEALVADNTSTTFEPIQEITETGITTTDGAKREFDMIVCATGFDIGFCPFFELKGMNGVKITDAWEPEIK
jgi:cation diffusion facilitator CzcD-associated flavoprotein CzcO